MAEAENFWRVKTCTIYICQRDMICRSQTTGDTQDIFWVWSGCLANSTPHHTVVVVVYSKRNLSRKIRRVFWLPRVILLVLCIYYIISKTPLHSTVLYLSNIAVCPIDCWILWSLCKKRGDDQAGAGEALFKGVLVIKIPKNESSSFFKLVSSISLETYCRRERHAERDRGAHTADPQT